MGQACEGYMCIINFFILKYITISNNPSHVSKYTYGACKHFSRILEFNAYELVLFGLWTNHWTTNRVLQEFCETYSLYELKFLFCELED